MSCITSTSIKSSIAPTWCPGCGDFLILNTLQKAIAEVELEEATTAIFYGIGCSGNMADFNKSYGFHGLHGRALASALGAKLANHDLKIIVIAGDGDMYGEGLNHFLSVARGNHDITLIIHNNERYSLTTGQSSPTTDQGTKTKSTPLGVIDESFNPIHMALAANASFVSRGYSAKIPQLLQLMKAAITHPGFALVDVMQLCPTFNKDHTHPWFAERIYDLAEQNHNPQDKMAAITRALETDKFPLGIFYQNPNSVPYHQQLPQLKAGSLISQWQPTVSIQPSLPEFI